MKKNALVLVLVVLSLTSCGNPPATVSLQVSPTSDIQNSATPTMTLMPKPTLTATSSPGFARKCLQVTDQEIALKEVASGTILLYFSPSNERILKNIQTGMEYKLPALSTYSSWAWYSQVSPNGKMLADIEMVNNAQSISTDNILWVVDAQAKVLAKVPFNRTDLGSVHWLDNESLVIDTEEYGTLLVINPFTGEKQVVSNELPNLFTHYNPWSIWRVVYSPDLEWVVYYGGEQPPEGPVVRDVVKNQNLWQVKGEQYGWPVWSPDGQEVAVVGGTDDTQIYLINRLGQGKPVLSEDQHHNSFAPSWSPDGKYLVFWDNGNLMVYDKHINTVVDLCIPWPKDAILSSLTPNWSGNSQQFIMRYTGYSSLTAQSLLIDLQKNVAYKIKDISNTFIVGWMNSLP